jgi:hypothetical protein
MNFHTLLGRIGGLAVIDILGTFLACLLISRFYFKENIIALFLILFIIGELVHLFLNIKTPFLKLILET